MNISFDISKSRDMFILRCMDGVLETNEELASALTDIAVKLLKQVDENEKDYCGAV